MRGMEVLEMGSNRAVTLGDAVLNKDSYHHMGPVYTADCIRKRRWRKGGLEYLVKWKGWPARFNTWEPESNILDVTLIKLFEQRKARARQRKLAARRGNGHGTSMGNERPLRAVIHHKDGKKCFATKTKKQVKTKPRPARVSPPTLQLGPHGNTTSSSCHHTTPSQPTHSKHFTIPTTADVTRPTDDGQHLGVNDRENKSSTTPQLDCLRGIKFKLGWQYNKRENVVGSRPSPPPTVIATPFTTHDVNASTLSSSPAGANISAVIPSYIRRESHPEVIIKSNSLRDDIVKHKGCNTSVLPPGSQTTTFQERTQLHDCRVVTDQIDTIQGKMCEEEDDDCTELLTNAPATINCHTNGTNQPDVCNDVMNDEMDCWEIERKNHTISDDNNNNMWPSCEGYSQKGIGMILLRKHNVWNVKFNTKH